MDNEKIGQLIYRLRKEKHLTQLQLAERMNISDKTVSKWERGVGCPDISMLPELSRLFEIDLEKLLSGELDVNDIRGGSMKKTSFYVCPNCGNVVTAMVDTTVSCCGKKLKPLEAKKAAEDEKLSIEMIEMEYFISSEHEMTKEHYISFVALLTGDSLVLRKQYPEWGLQTRIPAFAHGKLLWYCTKHGLFYQVV